MEQHNSRTESTVNPSTLDLEASGYLSDSSLIYDQEHHQAGGATNL